MMELGPYQSFSPSCRFAGFIAFGFGGLHPPCANLVVVGERSQHLREALGVFRLHIAKPEYRLDPVVYIHAAVVHKHPPYPAVQVLDCWTWREPARLQGALRPGR